MAELRDTGIVCSGGTFLRGLTFTINDRNLKKLTRLLLCRCHCDPVAVSGRKTLISELGGISGRL